MVPGATVILSRRLSPGTLSTTRLAWIVRQMRGARREIGPLGAIVPRAIRISPFVSVFPPDKPVSRNSLVSSLLWLLPPRLGDLLRAKLYPGRSIFDKWTQRSIELTSHWLEIRTAGRVRSLTQNVILLPPSTVSASNIVLTWDPTIHQHQVTSHWYSSPFPCDCQELWITRPSFSQHIRQRHTITQNQIFPCPSFLPRTRCLATKGAASASFK